MGVTPAELLANWTMLEKIDPSLRSLAEREGKGERSVYAYFIKMLPRYNSGAMCVPQK